MKLLEESPKSKYFKNPSSELKYIFACIPGAMVSIYRYVKLYKAKKVLRNLTLIIIIIIITTSKWDFHKHLKLWFHSPLLDLGTTKASTGTNLI